MKNKSEKAGIQCNTFEVSKKGGEVRGETEKNTEALTLHNETGMIKQKTIPTVPHNRRQTEEAGGGVQERMCVRARALALSVSLLEVGEYSAYPPPNYTNKDVKRALNMKAT